VKNPNLSDEIEKIERKETLTGIDQKLRDDQQIATKTIGEN